MSAMTRTETLISESAAYGGFVDAVGGIATIVERLDPQVLFDSFEEEFDCQRYL